MALTKLWTLKMTEGDYERFAKLAGHGSRSVFTREALEHYAACPLVGRGEESEEDAPESSSLTMPPVSPRPASGRSSEPPSPSAHYTEDLAEDWTDDSPRIQAAIDEVQRRTGHVAESDGNITLGHVAGCPCRQCREEA